MGDWNILLETTDDGNIIATVLEVSNLQISETTKQGEVAKVKQLLRERLAKAEIVKVSLVDESSKSENPLMKFAGIFQDDADFADIILEIQMEREVD